MTSRPPRWTRPARRLGLPLAVVGAAWLALLLHPQPLFAYELQRANVVLHARAPFPPQAQPLLDDVVRRVSRSPLYSPARRHDVFLCDTPALFAFFALWDRRVGGIAETALGGNVFIRPSSLTRDTVIGPSGDEKKGERTLAYYIAHEVTHVMTADHVGRWAFHRLSAFQREGYADHVAYAHALELARARTALVNDAPEMSPKRSGLYTRYELLVAYLLERRGMTVDELLAERRDQRAVEAELLAQSAL
jgi:hypothetical protein